MSQKKKRVDIGRKKRQDRKPAEEKNSKEKNKTPPVTRTIYEFIKQENEWT